MGSSQKGRVQTSSKTAMARREATSILVLVAVAVIPSIGLLRLSLDAAACWFLLWLSGAAIQVWPGLRAKLAPEPLGPVGRTSRLCLGAIAVWVGLRGGLTALLGHPVSWVDGTNVVTGLVLALALLYLGGNMILAAIKGWSGCEITAAPRAVFRWNVVLFCPLFTPLDLLDNLVRPRPQAGR